MVTEIIKKVAMMLMQLLWKEVRLEDLKPGDHIYRYGLYGLYSHHGIYVSKSYVIHFTRTQSKRTIAPSLFRTRQKQEISSPCPKCDYQKSINRGVVKTCINCFQQDGNKLRSLHCYEYEWPLLGFKLARWGTCTMLVCTNLPHEVIDKASELHANNTFGNYNLINNNCEHFATFCCTGICKSEQTAFIKACEQIIMQAKEWTMRLLQRN